ncbi:MAG TPA: DNA-formamidopyrimidine glycosylase family protein [Vicinamibacterales bacterium]|nr:DNA-formamidopyrimidine glycosylase family protein [Vicinamibacterales bacterium]
MPEGDTIHRAARTLHAALAGQPVTRFATGLAQLAQLDRDEPIRGRSVERVTAAGKHLLIAFSGGVVLRTHMRMNGSWHMYRPGERWQRARHSMRILIETTHWVAVAFNVYAAEFVRADAIDRHAPLAMLGPDLLGDFDRDEALARTGVQGARPIHEVLLDQRVMAGIGNVYKSEILFLSRLHPDTPANTLSAEQWNRLFELARRLLAANVAETSGSGIETYRGLRRTTGRMSPSDRLWVYSRGGRPCRTCGTPIASRKDGDNARVTYWCPQCQPALIGA